jgi:hypothetical protein
MPKPLDHRRRKGGARQVHQMVHRRSVRRCNVSVRRSVKSQSTEARGVVPAAIAAPSKKFPCKDLKNSLLPPHKFPAHLHADERSGMAELLRKLDKIAQNGERNSLQISTSREFEPNLPSRLVRTRLRRAPNSPETHPLKGHLWHRTRSLAQIREFLRHACRALQSETQRFTEASSDGGYLA